VAAHVLDLQLELGLGALLGALEGQVLEEVCGTIGLVGLGARAGIDPDTDGAGLGVGRVLSRDLEGGGSVGVARIMSSRAIGKHRLRTVKPLLRVVLWVVVLWTGVARLRVRPAWEGLMARMAFWARRPWLRLIASLRDAMAIVSGGGRDGVDGWCCSTAAGHPASFSRERRPASRVESSGPARCERPPANDRPAIRTELLLGCLPGFVRLRPPYRLERALCIAL
jgi:hypothetical protein